MCRDYNSDMRLVWLSGVLTSHHGRATMTHHNDDARMSELYAERAAGGEHEWYDWDDGVWHDRMAPDEVFCDNVQYRLKQPKPKELEVWVGHCAHDGAIISQCELTGSSAIANGFLDVSTRDDKELAAALNIPVGQQRKYKLVPVEDGE